MLQTFRSQVCTLEFKPSLHSRLLSRWQPRPTTTEFLYTSILEDAVKRAGLTEAAERIAVPDQEWWQRLCASCAQKACSGYGRRLLREKLVISLSQRLGVEEQYRLYGADIEKMELKEPTFVLGLPRCQGHQVQHICARSGMYMTPTSVDVMFPGVFEDEERKKRGTEFLKWITPSIFPQMRAVRLLWPNTFDDDLPIHLQVPQSVAWGLMHGLQDHLYKCLQEDQQPVYNHLRRVLRLLKFYDKVGKLHSCVEQEMTMLGIITDDVLRGVREEFDDIPWVIHSPLSLPFISCLHDAFPDMKVIWIHRALNQCLPSFCSSLAFHHSMYSGRRPTETQLAAIGEQVVGILGSGSEYAIDYMAQFPKERMVHWSNRDVKRSSIRLLRKTSEYFNRPIDHYRNLQAVSGNTEYLRFFRPKHDCELNYFGLHEGLVGEAFEAYITQFGEFAFEKRFGIKHQNLTPLSDTRQHFLGAKREKLGPREGHALGGAIGIQSGHYLQDTNAYK